MAEGVGNRACSSNSGSQSQPGPLSAGELEAWGTSFYTPVLIPWTPSLEQLLSDFSPIRVGRLEEILINAKSIF